MTEHSVVLHVYDLSMGMARQLSAPLLGRQLEGVWHTGLVVFGDEYFFGGGIQQVPPAQVVQNFGMHPVKTLELGKTTKTVEELQTFLRSISHKYSQTTYDLFHHNCNHFSDEVAKFLLNGTGIPREIVDLPGEVLNTPIGQMISGMYSNMQSQMHEQMIPLHQPGQQPSFTPPQSASASATQTSSAAINIQGEAMTIAVQLTASTPRKLSIKLSVDATIGDLQQQLQNETGYLPADQRLIFRGKVLSQPSEKLSAYGVVDQQSIHLVPKHGATPNSSTTNLPAASTGSTSDTPSSTSPAADTGRGAALNKLKQNSSENQRTAVQTLVKIIGNIEKNPNDAKFRKLKHANSAFEKRIVNIPGALDYILAMGFKRVEEDGLVFYVLEASAAAWEVLVASKAELETELRNLSGGSTPAVSAQAAAPAAAAATPASVPAALASLPGLQNMDPAMMQQMMGLAQNPDIMNMVQNNPMLSNMMSDPAMAQRAMEMFQNPNAMQQMMNDPMVQQLTQNPAAMQAMQQMMGGLGGTPAGNTAAASGTTPGTNSQNVATAAAAATSEIGQAQAELEMTEEEMLQEAIRKSLEMD